MTVDARQDRRLFRRVGLRHGVPLAAAAALAALAAPATAQEAPAAQRVDVTGAGARERREEVSGKQVITGEELARHGDTRLTDALRRVPGIGISGTGADLSIRLDGMSQEQTLVLLNGERVPPGQVLEALGLGMVERIEIVRGANVQWSGRGLAGTINIVTARTARQRQRDGSFTLGRYFGQATGQTEWNAADKNGDLGWRVGLLARADRERYPVDAQLRFVDTAGAVTRAYRVQTLEANRDQALTLTPQLQWGVSDGAQLQAESVLSVSRFSGAGEDLRSETVGELPRMQADRLAYTHDRQFGRLRLKGSWPWAVGTRASATVTASHGQRVQASLLTGSDFTGVAVRDSTVDSRRTDDVLSAKLDVEHRLGATQQLSAGVQLESNRRRENRVQRERIPSWEPDLTDERYDALARSLAVYVQNDWLPNKTTTLSLGARLERLDTRSEGNVFDGVARSYQLGSPTLNLLWRPAAATQWKLSLSRAYRLPEPRDIMPRRWTRPENSSLVPDFVGNPSLLPESAWTLAGGWDHRLGDDDSASVGVNAVLKRVQDMIQSELVTMNGQYLLRPTNVGRAWVGSLQLRGQGEWAAPWGGGVKLQASVAARASRVASLPGPDNRLPDQSPWEAQLEADHRPTGSAWSFTAAWRWRAALQALAPSGRLLGQGATQALDLSATRAWGPQDRLRLSVAGLGGSDALETTTRDWSGGVDSYRTVTQNAPRWRVQWMHSF